MSGLALAAATLSFSLAQPAQPVPALPPPQRVEIAPGRAISLRCAGVGEQAILFDAGGSDWSVIWATILPQVARYGRACAYDRAGLGSSDPAPGPRTPFAIVEDLRRLIGAAGITKPVVLVGHSLGGFNVKLYAALYPEDVSGLVLIDPAEERTWDRTRAWAVRRHGRAVAARAELLDQNFLAGLAERYRGCATTAQPNGFDPGSPAYRRCADPPRPALGDGINGERQRVQSMPTYQAAQAAEIASSVYANAQSDDAYARLFRAGMLGSRPIIVLTHEEPSSADPIDRLSKEQGLMLHRETARLSRRGRHQVVRDSGHYIQLDQPAVVVDAIRTVLRQLD